MLHWTICTWTWNLKNLLSGKTNQSELNGAVKKKKTLSHTGQTCMFNRPQLLCSPASNKPCHQHCKFPQLQPRRKQLSSSITIGIRCACVFQPGLWSLQQHWQLPFNEHLLFRWPWIPLFIGSGSRRNDFLRTVLQKRLERFLWTDGSLSASWQLCWLVWLSPPFLFLFLSPELFNIVVSQEYGLED